MGRSAKFLFKLSLNLFLIVIVPLSAVYVSSNNDIESSERKPIKFTIIVSTAANPVVDVGEIPIDSLISININRVDGSFSSAVAYAFERYQFVKYLDGEYNLSNFNTRAEFSNINGEFVPLWLNFTTGTEGVLRLVFTSNVDGIKIEGFYQYDVVPYIMRRGLDIFILVGIYYLLLLRGIPIMLKSYRWNRSNKRLRDERMAEEEEFYSRYRKNTN